MMQIPKIGFGNGFFGGRRPKVSGKTPVHPVNISNGMPVISNKMINKLVRTPMHHKLKIIIK